MARTNFANGVPNDVQAADLNQMGSEINANTAAIASSGGGVAVQTHAAAAKTTPADADEFPQADSAASFGLKRLTWANLKAAVKSYYDTVTSTLTNKTISGANNTLSNISTSSVTGLGPLATLTPTGTPSATTYLSGTGAYTTPAGGTGETGIGPVTVSGTPTSGQVPTAITGTTASWQTPSGGALDADLTAIAALTSAANQLPYATGTNAWAMTTLSPFARTLIDDADAATMRGTLGVGTGGGDASTNTASSVDNEVVLFSGTAGKTLKRATGTGIPKLTAGVQSIAAPGTDYYAPGSTDVAIADGGTGAGTPAAARTNLGSTTVGDAVFIAATAAAARTAIGAVPVLQVFSATSSATPTPDVSTYDESHWTALAAAATFGAPTGTPYDGQPHVIRVKDNGTARTLGYNAIYRAMGITLPTTTVVSKNLYLALKYNSTDTKWDVLDVRQEA